MAQGQYTSADIETPPPAAKGKYTISDIEQPRTMMDSVSDAAHALYEGSGAKTLMDLMGGASRDPEAAKKSIETAKGIIKGLAGEPSRISGELTKTGESMMHGDIPASLYHLAGSVPLVGAGAQQVGQDVGKGDYAKGFGHALGLLAPFLVPAGAAKAAEAAPAAAELAGKTGAAVKGAVQGAANELTTTVPISKYGVQMNVPKVAMTATGGGLVTRMTGISHVFGPAADVAGATIGAGVPIVKGAVRGAKAELAARAARQLQAEKAATFEQAASAVPDDVMAELTKDSDPAGAPPSAPTVQPEPTQAAPIVQPVTAAPPAPVQPRALLEAPPQAIQLPAAADTSYVKSVPAQYPEVETPPVSPQAEPVPTPKASPQRVVEIKANNMDAKAQRFAEALDAAGVTGDLRKIPAGRYSSTQIQKGATPGWANILDDLVHKKLLPEGETVPNTSIPAIIAKFKKIQADKIAKELADEAKRSGTIQ